MLFQMLLKTYSYSKGGFLPYSKKIIKNRLIDYYKSEQKHKFEYAVNPSVFDCEPNEDDEEVSIKIAVAEKLIIHENNSIKYEIEDITKAFK